MTGTKLEVDRLKKHFGSESGIISRLLRGGRDPIRAVDGVSLEVKEGETLGIAGESGCGKTTLGKTMIRLLEPTAGDLYFDGETITESSHQELNELRKDAQIVYQDPYKSLNPRFSVFRWVKEPLDVHEIGDKAERRERVYETLERVNLVPPETYASRYPSELSGGERQRVGIARALVLEPSFLMADEPTSMLDVSIRASVLELFEQLQEELELTYVFISHDLSMLKHTCDRIAIMYLGKIVERGPVNEVINNPKHPYTKALVSSVPVINPDDDREVTELEGEVPDPVNISDRCRFYSRCPEAMDECTKTEPPMYSVGTDHEARCILHED